MLLHDILTMASDISRQTDRLYSGTCDRGWSGLLRRLRFPPRRAPRLGYDIAPAPLALVG